MVHTYRKLVVESGGARAVATYRNGYENLESRDLTIWAMELSEAGRQSYATAAESVLGDGLRIEWNAKLSTQEMYFLHTDIARTAGWHPLESPARDWKEIFKDATTHVLFKGDRPVGVAHYVPGKTVAGEGAIELKYVGIRPEFIGHGLGGIFARELHRHTVQANSGVPYVLATTSFDYVKDPERLARAFHEKMGFEQKDEERGKVFDTRRFYQIAVRQDAGKQADRAFARRIAEERTGGSSVVSPS